MAASSRAGGRVASSCGISSGREAMAAVDKHAARFQRRLARAIEPYRSLLVDLVSGEMSPGDFEIAYMSRWGGDKRWMEDAVFEVVEEFFFVVEDYVDNPDLRDPSHGDL